MMSDLAPRLSDVCLAMAGQSATRYRIQKSDLSNDETFSIDGMLSVFLSVAAASHAPDPELRLGFIYDKKALVEVLPVVLAQGGNTGLEARWIERLNAVLSSMDDRASLAGGIVELEEDYAKWLKLIQEGRYYVWKSADELMAHFAAEDDKENGMLKAKEPKASKGTPLVSRREVASHLISSVAESIAKTRSKRGKPFFFLVRHPFGDFEADLAKALAAALNQDVEPDALESGDLVATTAELMPAGEGKRPIVHADILIDRLTNGNNVVAFAASPGKLPIAIRELVEVTIEMERFDAASLGMTIKALYDLGSVPDIPDGPWLRLVRPKDFLVNAYGGSDLVADIQNSVERRLALVATEQALSLDDIFGMPEAKAWATQLIEDLRLVELGPKKGGISWDEVDKGALFEGPPGVGKTSIARAIAKACGLKFVVGSAASWQAAGSLDAHLRALRESFVQAAEYAPAILFIDEIDSIGSRERLSDNNTVYQTDVINALLQELDGFDKRDRIIVLAATNYAENVDPALRRAGRLDRVICIPFPNTEGLKGIYRHYLAGIDHNLSQSDFDHVARASLGLTGADVELFVRTAKRMARRQGRKKVSRQDLMEQVYRTPPENQRQPMSQDDLYRTAVHEAGHAVVQLQGPDQGENINYVSIIPRSDGSLGFVATSDERAGIHATRETILHRVRTLLAGRAAESLFFGEQQISGGAGGTNQASDLAQATRTIEYLLTKQGWGSKSGLLWRKTGIDDDPELKMQADQMLSEQFELTKRALAENRTKLDILIAMLMERQEITGIELRDKMASLA